MNAVYNKLLNQNRFSTAMKMQEESHLNDNFLIDGFYLGRGYGSSIKTISALPKPDEKEPQTLDVRVEINVPVINTQLQSKGLIKLLDSIPADDFELPYMHRAPTASDYALLYNSIHQLGPFDFSTEYHSIKPKDFLSYMVGYIEANFEKRLWTRRADYFLLDSAKVDKKSARLDLIDWVDHIPPPKPFSLKILRIRYNARLTVTFEQTSSVPPGRLEKLEIYLRQIQQGNESLSSFEKKAYSKINMGKS
ncbi:hypothetical protein HY638_01565 [Candidatus Woesearchaeota archaeon]|nr:hypothetical protein [Candidatus Woesearchaeota archaeon]